MQERFHISDDDAIQRLRQKGEPIHLFGETSRERRMRLRSLELSEEHGMRVLQGHNDSRRFMRSTEKELLMEQVERRSSPHLASKSTSINEDRTEQDAPSTASSSSMSGRVPARMREGVGMHTVMDLKLMWTNPARVYPILYYTIKGLLADWELALAKRPEDVRHSAQGRQLSAMQMQTAEYIKPLLKALRRRSLEPDVLLRIAEIVHYMQQREYRKANDSYLQLSIGNAPWPIGITMAG